MRKLRDRRGLTLVESLASILIIALTVALLSTALVNAAKISGNPQAGSGDFSYTDAARTDGVVYYELPGSLQVPVEVPVVFGNDGSFWFYEYPEETD